MFQFIHRKFKYAEIENKAVVVRGKERVRFNAEKTRWNV
jgi:hypothetical protein